MSLSQPSEIVKRDAATRDAFLGGQLTLTQPAKGFRAGLDSVLLAAAVDTAQGNLLDLGAGVGTAALCALTFRPGLRATLVEADAEMAALARQNIDDNGLSSRATVLEVDVAGPGMARQAAGLAPDHYAVVIVNPPFYADGTDAAPQRQRSRQMPVAALERWMAAAAGHATPGGEVIVVHLAAQLPVLLQCLGGRFGGITVLPLTPRAGEAAHRVLVRGTKGSRAPFRLLASRALHEAEGRQFRPEFEAIFRGEARLHW